MNFERDRASLVGRFGGVCMCVCVLFFLGVRVGVGERPFLLGVHALWSLFAKWCALVGALMYMTRRCRNR